MVYHYKISQYKLKRKIQMITLIKLEKGFDKIQYPLLTKTPSKLEIEGNFFNLKKDIHK